MGVVTHVPLAGVAVKRMRRGADADVGYPFPVVAIVAGIVSWPGKVGYFVVDETSCCQRIHQLVELRGSLLFLHRQLPALARSEEHTSELQSLMRISYAVFFLNKKKNKTQ